jgi:concentrative nucleoside transporter, CNT family
VSDLRGLLGLVAILAVAFLVLNNGGRVPWRTVVVGRAIQVAFAALVPLVGKLVADKQETIFALQVVPVIIFLGALVGLLYYLRVIECMVEIIGGAIAALPRTSKVESLYAATVIFLGQSEAPLMIQS